MNSVPPLLSLGSLRAMADKIKQNNTSSSIMVPAGALNGAAYDIRKSDVVADGIPLGIFNSIKVFESPLLLPSEAFVIRKDDLIPIRAMEMTFHGTTRDMIRRFDFPVLATTPSLILTTDCYTPRWIKTGKSVPPRRLARVRRKITRLSMRFSRLDGGGKKALATRLRWYGRATGNEQFAELASRVDRLANPA